MLCSKCYKDIQQGKEIQVEGTIFCKKCALDSLAKKEANGRCNRCFKLIDKDEVTYEVYENWGTESSEKLIKCQFCYEKWSKIAKLKRKTWNLTNWFYKVFLPFSMWFTLAIITVSKNEKHAGKENYLLMLILFTSIMLLSPLFLDFIVFIYIELLKRKYRKKKRKLIIIS